MTTEPFAFTSGPKDAKLALVGEAWGGEEELVKMPFVGKSGQELTKMLSEAGIRRSRCFLTNVFPWRPESNNIETLCAKKGDVGSTYYHSPLRPGKYVKPEFLGEVNRLKEELQGVKPNLIIALGATALWSLLGTAAIGALRGTITMSTLIPGVKLLPTFHPASVLYNWSSRVICVPDFMKGKREMEFPEIRRPKRQVLVNPTLEEIDDEIDKIKRQQPQYLSIDIETGRGQIKTIGFATNSKEAFIIPFVDLKQPDGSYWQTYAQELYAWNQVKQLLETPITKLFQNGLFDLQYILRMGFRPRHCCADTMLLSHSLFPELPKGLGFLGSIFTNEPAWKLMRQKGQDELKRDE